MEKFLVELYVSRADVGAIERGIERTRRAAEALTREGTPVRHLRSIYVPEDETCFFIYEADEREPVDAAARASGLPFERVATAVAEVAS